MKIAIIGGTGSMGSGLGERLAKSHEVIIGSRDPAKAKAAAARIRGARGADYSTAARECDSAIVAIPFSAIDSMSSLVNELSGKLVISVINPMRFENGMAVLRTREWVRSRDAGGQASEEQGGYSLQQHLCSVFRETRDIKTRHPGCGRLEEDLRRSGKNREEHSRSQTALRRTSQRGAGRRAHHPADTQPREEERDGESLDPLRVAEGIATGKQREFGPVDPTVLVR